MFKMCVIGNPIKHSKSPWIHQQFAKQLNLPVEYTRIEAPIDAFVDVVREFQQQGGAGLNISVPFKEQAFKLANSVSERAALAKAVNTFLFRGEHDIFGDNTDGIGLVKDIQQNLLYSLKDKRILILGAGGAVRGILLPILEAQPKTVVISNRTPARAVQLVKELAKFNTLQSLSYEELVGLEFDLIIDGTSSFSTSEQLPKTLRLTGSSLCYDLKYQQQLTPFLIWAKQQGATKLVNGLGMLIEQAAVAFKLWTGKQPDTRPIIQLAQENLL